MTDLELIETLRQKVTVEAVVEAADRLEEVTRQCDRMKAVMQATIDALDDGAVDDLMNLSKMMEAAMQDITRTESERRADALNDLVAWTSAPLMTPIASKKFS